MRVPEQRERDLLELLRQIATERGRDLRARDVLVVASDGLRRRREDRVIQARGFLQTRWQARRATVPDLRYSAQPDPAR